jgi:hypothetical protein
MNMRSIPLLTVSLAVGALIAAQASVASTVTMTFNEDLSGTTSGSASLAIQDIGANEVQVTLIPNFSATSLQTITGLWLNDPGLTSLTVTPVSPLPNAYVGSTYSTTQTIVPSGATTGLTGQYDSYIQFNNGSGAVIRGTTAETFDVTAVGGSGFSALSFDLADAPKGTGSPSNIDGLIGMANYLGTAGSGVGFIAATGATVAPVPLPTSLACMAWVLGGLGLLVRRRS